MYGMDAAFVSLTLWCEHCATYVFKYAIAFEEHHDMTSLHFADARPRVSSFAVKVQ